MQKVFLWSHEWISIASYLKLSHEGTTQGWRGSSNKILLFSNTDIFNNKVSTDIKTVPTHYLNLKYCLRQEASSKFNRLDRFQWQAKGVSHILSHPSTPICHLTFRHSTVSFFSICKCIEYYCKVVLLWYIKCNEWHVFRCIRMRERGGGERICVNLTQT